MKIRVMGATVALVLAASCGGNKKKEAATPQPAAESGNEGAAAKNPLMGQALADSIMAQWQRQHPGRNWEAEVRRSHPDIPKMANNREMIGAGRAQGEGNAYGRFSKIDVLTWKRETEKLVLDGARIFHDAKALGGTVGVSCDMCHPDAANTHPETYPKFQVQMGRVALLRDMINWCLINPIRAPAMTADDPRMRALEAYIIAQRKGKKLDYGKH